MKRAPLTFVFCTAALLAAPSASAQKPQAGDHVRVYSKKGVYHHGVMTAHDRVVHRDNLMAAGHVGVKETSLQKFSSGHRVEVVNDRTRPRHEVVASAQQAARQRDKHYNPLTNNCEHEATKHVSGKPRSAQVRNASLPQLGFALGVQVMTTPLRMMAALLD